MKDAAESIIRSLLNNGFGSSLASIEAAIQAVLRAAVFTFVLLLFGRR